MVKLLCLQRVLITLLIVGFFCLLTAQSNIGIGQWRSYLPYQDGRQVTQSNTKIIYATDWSIFMIDKEDQSLSFLSTVNGLSETGITDIEYDLFNDQLIVAYDNSNIDIIVEDEIINISDIKDNTNIVGNRNILDIHIADENFVYFATSFGLVQYNLRENIFGFTVFIDLPVLNVTSSEGLLFIATEDGIYYVDTKSNANLADFSSWDLLDNQNGLPSLYSANVLGAFEGNVYTVIDSIVYKGSNLNFVAIDTFSPGLIPSFINDSKDYLMLGLIGNSFFSQVNFYDKNDQLITSAGGCVNAVLGAEIDENGKVWYAETFENIRTSETITSGCSRSGYDSPLSHAVSNIDHHNGKIYVASGGVSESFGYLTSRNGYYIFEEGNWTNVNDQLDTFLRNQDILNVYNIIHHPTQNKVYLASFWAGLVERNLDTGEDILHTKNNSSLSGIIGDEARVAVTDFAFDEEGNLWVCNFGSVAPLCVLTPEGEWYSYQVPNNPRITDIAIDQNGYKWLVASGNNGGIIIYDNGGDFENPLTHRTRFLGVGNSTISTQLVNSVAVDLNGDVWVGTAEGPIVFECGPSSFETPGCEGNRRKVTQGTDTEFLLQTEDIRTIEIDGANRKWFGTRRGIFVQSPDGEDQVLKLDQSNSPLFDNTIIDLEYIPESGEMFIGTNKGLLSYRSDAIAGTKRHNKPVFAYPNPIRPEYTGPIAIKGLAQDAKVKITDINGQLVHETTALGGQAIWDGKDYTGRKAASGVYLVFSSSTSTFDDVDAFVTKIMIVR